MARVLDNSEIAFRIASAFLRQRYPLSDLGKELWLKVKSSLDSGVVPVDYIDILPTVENPREELFADFNITPEQESKVFGWGLSTIQSHKGCTHHCKQCYMNAGPRLQMMPFAAAIKIASKKKEYEKKAVFEWLDWEAHLKLIGENLREFPVRRFINKSRKEDLVLYSSFLIDEWNKMGFKVLKTRGPFDKSVLLSDLRKHYLDCVPINFGSMIRTMSNCIDNDPLEYRDFLFLHRDGSPADYGDFFRLMSTHLRPVTITTAGWFSEDEIACRAMGKVIKQCAEDPELARSDHRISVSMWERHALKNLDEYVDELERMLKESSSLNPIVDIYYDEDDREHKCNAYCIAILIGHYLKESGNKGRIYFDSLSFRIGRAATIRDGSNDYDPDAGIDGVHILPSGEVRKKPDFQWQKLKDKNGKARNYLVVPKDSIPEPTGIYLF